MFYALKVITAHLSMLPGSSKNLRIVHCGIDCNSDVALLASFCAMSPRRLVETYMAATCFYAAQPAQKGHELQ